MVSQLKFVRQFLPVSILVISIFSILRYIQLKTGLAIGNTFFWWLVQALILYLFFIAKRLFVSRHQSANMLFVKWYLIWNIICFCRGIFIAETYWDGKALVGNMLALLVPLVAYAAMNTTLFQSLLRFYFKYTLPLFLILSFMIIEGAYGFYLIPISFLSLFLPLIRTPWRWLVLSTALFVILVALGNRSTVFKFGVPLVLCLFFYVRYLFPANVLELIRKVLFIAPFLLLILGLWGIFNVFKMSDYIDGNYTSFRENSDGVMINENLATDTRTFLYVEVLQTAVKHNSWLIGRSPARGNESEAFGDEDLNGRGERVRNEVAILNVFTWTGIIGVILYMLIFYHASALAVNQSNNVFSKIVGVFVAFRWLYSWVEDVNNFSLNTFFLWFMVGFCFSKSFRAMSNNEIKLWIAGIFQSRYLSLYQGYLKRKFAQLKEQ